MVAVVIIGVALVSIVELTTFSLRSSQVKKQTTQAADLTQEAMEIVRNFRDGTGWSDNDAGDQYDGLGVVTAGASYHPQQSTGAAPRWQMVSGQETINEFTRAIVFRNVCRNSSTDNITGITDTDGAATTCAGSGGVRDADTKHVTVTVSWTEKARAHEVELVTYVTNWK